MAEETNDGSLLQGSQLPSTVTTTQTQAVAPEFYTNYLQDIANLGQNAVTQGGVAGLSPLQQQAFDMAPQASFAGSDTMGQAANLTQQAGTTTAPSVIQNYMNPYTQNVVDEMARLNQQNIQRSIMPALNAAGVSSGGLGSTRMANVTGQTLADMAANLTGQQYTALSQGYRDAMTAAQADLGRQLQAGSNLGNIGTAQSNLSLAGLKNLSELGAQQQAQGQRILDYPMQQVQNFAKLLQGYQIPTGSTQQITAPGQQGQFSNAPLAQISGLLTALGAFGQGSMGFGGKDGFSLDSLLAYLKGGGEETPAPSNRRGGYIRKADGGAIQGGLQSMVQGMNSNIPTRNGGVNSNIPQIGMNPPQLNIQSLDYQNDPEAYNLNRSTMTGMEPNTGLMVG